MRCAITVYLLCLFSLSASSQVENPNALTLRLLTLDHNLANAELEDLPQTTGFELSYQRQLNTLFALSAPLAVSIIDVGERTNRTTYSLGARGLYFPLGAQQLLAPYLQAGVGLVAENDAGTYGQLPVGAGAQLWLSRRLALNLNGEFRLAGRENRNNIAAGLGLTIRFNARDSDGDGVPDRRDACPQTAGYLIHAGCPDSDGDGISDPDDRCPATPGLSAHAGCPDADRDGVIDQYDKCPTTPGKVSLGGCPDADGDGIADPDDQCPRDAGPAATNGCPDGDGDGIIDRRDDCPGEAGPHRFRGCPDTDGDGLPDGSDRCPTLPGNLVTGCPDRDGDGFNDDEDECPDTAGPLRGCADTDGDGIPDKDDRCPRRAGTAALRGCPQ